MRILLAAITLATVGLLSGCGGPAAGTCEDVTSYDDNWDNDMKCKNLDGSIFYTDYSGAEEFEASN